MKSLLRRIFDARRSRPIAVKMITFAMVGLGNTVIDLSIFTLGYSALELPLVPSNVLAWLVAVSCSPLRD